MSQSLYVCTHTHRDWHTAQVPFRFSLLSIGSSRHPNLNIDSDTHFKRIINQSLENRSEEETSWHAKPFLMWCWTQIPESFWGRNNSKTYSHQLFSSLSGFTSLCILHLLQLLVILVKFNSIQFVIRTDKETRFCCAAKRGAEKAALFGMMRRKVSLRLSFSGFTGSWLS